MLVYNMFQPAQNKTKLDLHVLCMDVGKRDLQGVGRMEKSPMRSLWLTMRSI